ncbi:MAG TPA: DUF4931 domain-containing protein [Alphaproteobacteria bacterium]|nr:DUF4931 domain-containing protein [Alphaproteobacteria bacterium]
MATSELRQDPLTGVFTILAPHRQGRPRDRAYRTAAALPTTLPRHDPSCPFCPARSGEPTVPILVLPNLSEGGWRARILANTFPALRPDAGATGEARALPGRGRHEVIVETPRHDQDLSEMEHAQLQGVVQLTLARMRQLARDPEAIAVFVFRNHGTGAGSSLIHAHGQLIALPFVPAEMARREAHLAAAHASSGRNPFETALEAERASGRRVIAENGSFTAYVPFAAEAPCELRIQPLRASTDPIDLDPPEIAPLADMLGHCLRRLKEKADDPPYNLMWWTMSRLRRRAPFAGWCIRIVPRIVPGGGFEKASGVSITSTLPEADAARLRGDVMEV